MDLLLKLRARFVLIKVRYGAAPLAPLVGYRVLVLDYRRFGLILLLLFILFVLALLVLGRRDKVVLATRGKYIISHIIEKVQGLGVDPRRRNPT